MTDTFNKAFMANTCPKKTHDTLTLKNAMQAWGVRRNRWIQILKNWVISDFNFFEVRASSRHPMKNLPKICTCNKGHAGNQYKWIQFVACSYLRCVPDKDVLISNTNVMLCNKELLILAGRASRLERHDRASACATMIGCAPHNL